MQPPQPAVELGKYLAVSIVVTLYLKELAPKVPCSGRKWRLSGK